MNEAPERIIADLQAKLTECCLQALAADGQAAEALDRAIKAEAEAANLRAQLAEARQALSDLLDDTQHANHNCGDEWCPVKAARAILARIAEDAQ